MDFPGRMATLRNGLNNDITSLYQEYTLAKNASGSIVTQNNSLQGEINQLKSRLANIKQEGEKYDREFLDYSSEKGAYSFARMGIRTRDEWVLFIFFVAYAFMFISFIAYSSGGYGLGGYETGIVNNSVGSIVAYVIAGLVIGVMITAVMIRFI